MQIGQAHVDFDAQQISGPAGNFSVEPKVMEVLSVLLANAGEVVTRDALIDQVWGVGHGGDERLSRAISLLRKALGDTRGKHDYIQTIPKAGYKLTVELEPAEDDDEIDVEETRKSAPIIPPPKKTIKGGLIAIISIAIFALVSLVYVSKAGFLTSETPLVIIMDSAHPARIYDEHVKSEGGTNADILSDILADLPIRTQKELISPSWNRYEAITQFRPDLIVIHYSGFKQEDSSGDRPQLRLLIEYFIKTETQFLIYSRADNAWLDGNMGIVLKDLYAQYPKLKERVKIYPLLEYGTENWKDQATAQGIKLRVKEILDLE